MPIWDLECKNCNIIIEDYLDIVVPSHSLLCEVCGNEMEKLYIPRSVTYQLNFPGGGSRKLGTRGEINPAITIIDGDKPGNVKRDIKEFKGV